MTRSVIYNLTCFHTLFFAQPWLCWSQINLMKVRKDSYNLPRAKKTTVCDPRLLSHFFFLFFFFFFFSFPFFSFCFSKINHVNEFYCEPKRLKQMAMLFLTIIWPWRKRSNMNVRVTVSLAMATMRFVYENRQTDRQTDRRFKTSRGFDKKVRW